MKKHYLTHIHTQFRPNCMLQTTRTTRPPLHHLSLRPPTPPMCPCSIAVASRYHLGCSAIANPRREIFTCVSCCIECHLDGRQMVSHQSHARWGQALEHTCWLECAAMVKHTMVVVLLLLISLMIDWTISLRAVETGTFIAKHTKGSMD